MIAPRESTVALPSLGALIVALGAAACATPGGEQRATRTDGDCAPAAVGEPSLASRAGAGSPLAGSRQLLVVTTASWSATTGVLQRYERARAGDPFRAVGAPIDVVVGRAGLGWGRGLHGDGTPADAAPAPVKREGDGRAPAGVFRLGTAFGDLPAGAPERSRLRVPYLAALPTSECVDDPRSRHYNRLVDRAALSPADVDWSSSETLRRDDALYRLAVVVRHNDDPPVAGAGSCIFLHVWRDPAHPTVGCTAMALDALVEVARFLDPAAAPLLVQLPACEHARLAARLGLPSLQSSVGAPR